ncbi:MAG: ATP-binding protein [Candidatus Electryonea clarkiae]|nr:ATP-binding protein [Candidatus Electryonea clarkiae]
MTQKKTFKISSALKDIIGKDLITNDFIAVFELVKNAFDANAKRVDIIFEGLTTQNPRLIIKDTGKGMDLVDLESKWLFVAYSAKKAGVEDYRDKISSKRKYAGAKGIGRFSCDRLGSSLVIYSRKNTEDSKLHKLKVDWKDFELDMKEEFATIVVDYESTTSNPHGLKLGTVLEITELRESWDREKLLKLKQSLQKLINPNQDNDPKHFAVFLNVPEEQEMDKEIGSETPWDVVNGKVENFIFEKLELKTTQIHTSISEDGSEITTRLIDRGEFVYEIREQNPFILDQELIKDIAIHLFSLNRSAKLTFTRHMGINAVEFGSVFLYKNGFRIHPIGDVVGGDIFALDRRKQQGQARFLGTRDLIGRVEINGENPAFQETSSRDGGIIRNDAFEALSMFFMQFALRRLEKYTVDVIKFGNTGDLNVKDGVPEDVKKSVVMEIIQNLTKPKSIIDIKYNPNFLDILGNVSERSLNSILINFARIAAETNNAALEKDAKKAQHRLKELERARNEAEEETRRATEARTKAEKEAKKEAERARSAEKEAELSDAQLKRTESQNLFLRSMVSNDVSNVVSLHHHVGIAAGTIDNYIKNTMKQIKSGKPMTTDDFLLVLERISYQSRKITTTTRFATKANFMLTGTKITDDLCAFIREYISNICLGLIKTKDGSKNMSFNWMSDAKDGFETRFKPLEITIILDNLISNSRKANAKLISFTTEVNDERLQVVYEDDGIGFKPGTEEKIFDLGFTTTTGSGLGLYQVAEVIKQIGGRIEVQTKKGRGIKLSLWFERK